jgi:hypothetical protein
MPRKRQTITGEDAQNIKSVSGQRYGEGVAQQAMQRAMPAPDVTGNIETGAPTAGPLLAGGASPSPMANPGVAEFLAANRPGLLAQTQRPDEPITAGLSSGPGAGREALTMGPSQTPIGRFFERLSTETGNPQWRRLRERAGL